MKPLLRLALAMYVGEKCQGCGHEFASPDDLVTREVVWWPHDGGRVGCKTCYESASEVSRKED